MISKGRTKAARALVGMMQRELAEAANVSRETINDFETGKRKPIPNNLVAIMKAFEVSGVRFTETGVELLEPRHKSTGGPDGGRGVEITAETRTKLRGRTFSPEHRAKLSLAKLGKTLSPAHRGNLHGKTFSPETRAKLQATNILSDSAVREFGKMVTDYLIDRPEPGAVGLTIPLRCEDDPIEGVAA